MADGRTVVVLGGTGHVGSYLCPRLTEESGVSRVVCVSRGKAAPYAAAADEGLDPRWEKVSVLKIDRDEDDRNAQLREELAKVKPHVVIDMVCFTAHSCRELVQALCFIPTVEQLIVTGARAAAPAPLRLAHPPPPLSCSAQAQSGRTGRPLRRPLWRRGLTGRRSASTDRARQTSKSTCCARSARSSCRSRAPSSTLATSAAAAGRRSIHRATSIRASSWLCPGASPSPCPTMGWSACTTSTRTTLPPRTLLRSDAPVMGEAPIGLVQRMRLRYQPAEAGPGGGTPAPGGAWTRPTLGTPEWEVPSPKAMVPQAKAPEATVEESADAGSSSHDVGDDDELGPDARGSDLAGHDQREPGAAERRLSEAQRIVEAKRVIGRQLSFGRDNRRGAGAAAPAGESVRLMGSEAAPFNPGRQWRPAELPLSSVAGVRTKRHSGEVWTLSPIKGNGLAMPSESGAALPCRWTPPPSPAALGTEGEARAEAHSPVCGGERRDAVSEDDDLNPDAHPPESPAAPHPSHGPGEDDDYDLNPDVHWPSPAGAVTRLTSLVSAHSSPARHSAPPPSPLAAEIAAAVTAGIAAEEQEKKGSRRTLMRMVLGRKSEAAVSPVLASAVGPSSLSEPSPIPSPRRSSLLGMARARAQRSPSATEAVSPQISPQPIGEARASPRPAGPAGPDLWL